jgi:probable O-glycosylation ligase (exosortase A-associated)
MRDFALMALICSLALVALRFPWIGVMLWTWVSIMNPHRYTFGFAYEAPVALIAAVSTLIGFLGARDKANPFKGPAVVVFLVFALWMTLSWALGLDPEGDYFQWNKVIKVYFMILIALSLLHTKQHIFALIWVCAGSLALLGIKGGIFTIMTGGGERVWGPPGSFIEDNNEFAVALIMTIPLLRFLQMQLQSKWGKRLMLASMVLIVLSSIGSHSRGALLAILATVAMLWLRDKKKLSGLLVIIPVAVAVLAFAPDRWFNRMETLENYEADKSAMGRISAWWTAFNLAKERPLGVGFNPARSDIFAMYSPYPEMIQGAHSIYFQILGNHGFIGLFLWLGMWVLAWRSASWLRKNAADIPQAKWAAEFGAMAQASMVAYFVGGAFLSLAYFDLPYNVMMAVVLTRVWVQQKAWLTEPAPPKRRWLRVPGLSGPKPVASS